MRLMRQRREMRIGRASLIAVVVLSTALAVGLAAVPARSDIPNGDQIRATLATMDEQLSIALKQVSTRLKTLDKDGPKETARLAEKTAKDVGLVESDFRLLLGMFPNVFDEPFADTFDQLKCVDQRMAEIRGGPPSGGRRLADLTPKERTDRVSKKADAAEECLLDLIRHMDPFTSLEKEKLQPLKEHIKELGKTADSETPHQIIARSKKIEKEKQGALPAFPKIGEVLPFQAKYNELECIDQNLGSARRTLDELSSDSVVELHAQLSAAQAEIKKATDCKMTLESELKGLTAPCTAQAVANGGNVQVSFKCSKVVTVFSFKALNGHNVTGVGQVSNTATQQPTSCSVTSGTATCTPPAGGLPADSTTSFSSGTNPPAMSGDTFELTVTFSDGTSKTISITAQ